MPNQKISELSAIETIDNALDVLPIVDTSTNTTKKVTPTQIKAALSLNNVDNTSDLNKPISTATQTALDGKQASLGFTAENAANKSTSVVIDQASNVKYPTVKALYDWAVATFQAALGYTPANRAGDTFTGAISATNLSGTNTGDNATNSQYSGLATSKQDTLVSGTNIKTVNSTSLLGSGDVAVQATLVSGTNIKTINSTSLLGSGDIVISASPSGVAGAIQFSNGSAFASDAANLFWDDTNNRLGVGTNAPTSPLTVIGASQFGNASGNGSIETFDGFYSYSFGKNTSIYNPNSNYTRISMASSQTFIDNASGNYQFRSAGDTVLNLQSGNLALGNSSTTPTARLQVKGSGSTSATTSLLVQNSSGNNALQIRDDRVIIMAGLPTSSSGLPTGALWNNLGVLSVA